MLSCLSALRGLWRRVAIALLPLAFIAGCASFVAPYDQTSRDRIAAISTDILGLYQEILSTAPSQRRAKVIALQPRYDQIETALRVHRLLEEARPQNAESVRIATRLMNTFARFRTAQLSDDRTALTNATLGVQRDELERQLAAALMGEDAKKLANVSQGG